VEELSAGQVILAAFPFSDLTSKKMRPCFVIGIAEFDDIVVCQITSQPYSSNRAITLKPSDFKHGSIVQTSYIRPDKLATLDRVTINQLLGTTNDNKIREVRLALKEFFEIP